MGTKVLLWLVLIATVAGKVTAVIEMQLVDKIVVTGDHPEGTFHIFLSDLRPSLDGTMRTVESEIDDNLILLDAKRLNLEVTSESIDQSLEKMQKDNNITRDDLEDEFDRLGHYTFEQGKEQLRRKNLRDMTLNFVTRAINAVTFEEVDCYAQQNPIFIPAQYTIQFGSASKEENSQKDLQEQIQKIALYDQAILWDDPLVINEQELAADKQFIRELPLNEITFFEEHARTIEFVRLVNKKESEKKSTEERYREIENKLKKEKYESAVKKYKESLRSDTTLRYF